MVEDNQKQWANELSKTRYQLNRQKTVPLEAQKKQLQEEMAYYKDRLEQALKAKDKETVGAMMKMLITLRARQVMIHFHELQELVGELDAETIKTETKRYVKDCLRLTMAAEQLVGKT